MTFATGVLLLFVLALAVTASFLAVLKYSKVVPDPKKGGAYDNTMKINAETDYLSNERVRLMMDAMPLACHIWDRNIRLIECNAANFDYFKVGDKKDIIYGFNKFSPEYQPDGSESARKSVEYIARAFEDGKCVFMWEHVASDGTPLPSEITLVRVMYEGDYVVVAYIRDLREQIQMQNTASKQLESALEKAKEANQTKTNFLANMSHEMRTPLNAVVGLSELMLNDAGVKGATRDNLSKINVAGITLLNIINDILDISKIESGKFELTPIEYDTPSFINDTVSFNIMRLSEKPVAFVLNVDENLPSQLYGDDLRLKQVCNNILSNACKYTMKGSIEWSVTFEDDGGSDDIWLSFSVKDTGIGIKAEDIGKLFQNYGQVNKMTTRNIEGTGLGLSLTKRLLDMMEGEIDVESVYGEGSVFSVRLRQKVINRAPIGAVVAKNLQSFNYIDEKRNFNKKLTNIRLPYAKVLIVDDVVTNLDVARGMMNQYGMQIDCVTSGMQAIECIRNERVKYNAVFMDHMMPNMDGIEATRIIREEIGTDYARSVPIIALTANAIIGNEDMFLKNGFQAFLSKPISMSMLDMVIKNWVRDKEYEKNAAIYEAVEPSLRRVFETEYDINDLCIAYGILESDLNVEKGIERFGNEDSYLTVLDSYIDNTPALLTQLASVTEPTLPDYSVTVHGIKGSSYGIYAENLGARAELLESAAKAGDYKYVNENNARFINDVGELIQKTSEMLIKFRMQKSKPVLREPEKNVLSSLLAACKSYDIDGVDSAMEELGKYEYETNADLYEWLKEKVTVMGFKPIAERLAAIGIN